jgi:hypothetical protein
MKITKNHTYTTDVYDVEDGPVEDTEPGYLTQGKFKADFLSVSYMDGELEKVHLKGPGLKANGGLGKSSRSRTYFRSQIPQWVIDFLHDLG